MPSTLELLLSLKGNLSANVSPAPILGYNVQAKKAKENFIKLRDTYNVLLEKTLGKNTLLDVNSLTFHTKYVEYNTYVWTAKDLEEISYEISNSLSEIEYQEQGYGHYSYEDVDELDMMLENDYENVAWAVSQRLNFPLGDVSSNINGFIETLFRKNLLDYDECLLHSLSVPLFYEVCDLISEKAELSKDEFEVFCLVEQGIDVLHNAMFNPCPDMVYFPIHTGLVFASPAETAVGYDKACLHPLLLQAIWSIEVGMDWLFTHMIQEE